MRGWPGLVLFIGILLAPAMLGIAGACVWKAVRGHRPRLLIVAFISLTFEPIVVAAGTWQLGYDLPTTIAERDCARNVRAVRA